MLDLEFAEVTDVGRVRPHNEDFLGHVEPANVEEVRSLGWLFVVADGVGGQDLGEVASRTAVETALDEFKKSGSGETHAALLTRIVRSANRAVYEAGTSSSPGGVRMATTIVACALRFDRAVVAHVGDSRCYVLRGGQLMPLTRDHSVVAEQMRLGVMSSREASRATTRHVLTKSLGNELFVAADVAEHQIFPDDVLLLSTDGLHGAVAEPDIQRVLVDYRNLNQGAQVLVDLANEKSGGDNVTVQLIRIRSVERMGMYRGRMYKLRT